ncbi:MAG: glycosyltransferase family 2 protein [Epsilonproteobacteria bacterium]|nr:MAG: glycosyltransferase family 2 protein [Campylobacterota bacterium]
MPNNNKSLSSLSVFMPAYNEAHNIKQTIQDAKKAVSGLTQKYEIIIINDGSTDETKQIVTNLAKKDSHIRLISHSKNEGYGTAVKSGLKASKMDWIFFTDSDGQFKFDELSEFVRKSGKKNLVIGYRRKRMDPFHRVFLAQVLLKIWNYILFGLKVRDVDCAYKLFHRDLLTSLKLETSSAITVSEFIIKTKLAGYKIIELPVTHYPRQFGEQTGGNWRVIARAAFDSLSLFKELRLS